MKKRDSHEDVGGPDARRKWKESARHRAALLGVKESEYIWHEEFPTATSHIMRTQMHRSFLEFLYGFEDFDYFITLRFNQPRLTYQIGRQRLKKLGALLDSEHLGKHWSRYPSAERTFFIAVPEGGQDALHYHILAQTPRQTKVRWHCFPGRPGKRCRHLSQYLTELVRKKGIAPGGDVVVDTVPKTPGGGNVAAYITKDCWRQEVWENVVLSTEFHSSG